MISLISLIPCELNCFDHSAYEFFEKDEHEEYLIAYKFKYNGEFDGEPTYAYMKKGHYHDGGIALVVDHGMLYGLGETCYITGYCPIQIIDNENKEK